MPKKHTTPDGVPLFNDKSVQGSGVTSPDDLMIEHGLDPAEWEIIKTTIMDRGGTRQQWAKFARRVLDVKWPVVQPVRVPVVETVAAAEETSFESVLVVPDMHVGYRRQGNGHLQPLHDERACSIVAQIILDYEPDRVVMLGDNLDLAEWSSKYLVTPDLAHTTQEALNYLAGWIASWRGHVQHVDYIEGNHEKRLPDALVSNLNAACGVTQANCPDDDPVMSVPHMLGLKDLGVNWVGDYPRGTVWLNDNLRCTHAQSLAARSGMTVANSLNGATCSSIFGHAHRVESAHQTTHRRRGNVIYGAYCMGTLGHIDGRIPSNTAAENWQQGFGWVNLYDNNRFDVTQTLIFDGECYFNGEMYTS